MTRQLARTLLGAALLLLATGAVGLDAQDPKAPAEDTAELLLFLAPGTDPAAYAREHGLIHKQTLRSNRDAHVFAAADAPRAHAHRRAAGADPRVRRAYLNRKLRRVKCAWEPLDPYYANGTPTATWPGQWHLGNGAVPGVDIKTPAAWANDITGLGVTVGIVDDGLETAHPDLNPNYVAGDSWDFGENDEIPDPVVTGGPNEDRHGTSVAGVAAARGGNGIGGTGAAPHAGLAGLRVDFGAQTTASFVDATLYRSSLDSPPLNIHIKNHSYGYSVPFVDSQAERDAVELSAAAGTIHLFAAGNARNTTGEDSNKQDVQSSPHVITVAALGQNGTFSPYSSFGANVFVTAPSSGVSGFGITTTDRSAGGGYNKNTNASDGDGFPDRDYTSTFGGTSSATPLAAGVMALVKQVQPALDVRFAKHLLVLSSQQIDPGDATPAGGWTVNAASRKFNPNYGFGLLDAQALTQQAVLYSGVTPLQTESTGTITLPALEDDIPDGDPDGLIRTFNIGATAPLEEVLVTLNITHTFRGDVEAFLTSARGTTCRLFAAANDSSNDIDWTFVTNAFWGEDPSGEWSLKVRDVLGQFVGTWNSFAVTVRMGQLILDTTPPAVSSVLRAQANPTSSASVDFTVAFSRSVTGVDASDFALSTTGGIAGASVSGVSGSGTVYTVSVATGTGSGTIRLDVLDDNSIVDGSATPLSGPYSAGQVYTVDKDAPSVVRVRSTSSDGSYGSGASLNVTVDFSEAVTLAGGNLRVALSTGDVVSIAPFGTASSAAGSYLVGAGDNSADLDSTSPLTLSAGTLLDAAGNACTLSIPGGQTLAALHALVVDTTAPQIASVDSSTADGTYGIGASIDVTVTFTEAVALVGGNLQVTLSTGDIVSIPPFASSLSASGSYVVGAGDNSASLDADSPLTLSAGTLRDAAGNNASLAVPGSQNLADLSDLVVETTGSDLSPPVAGTVLDGWSGADLDVQLSTTTLAAHWSGFSDAQSGIAGYAWALGTTPGGEQVRAFSAVGLQTAASTSAVDALLSLSPGTTYYVSVRATNGAGLTSTASSDGVQVTGTDLAGPPAPSSFYAIGGDQEVLLDWTASAGAFYYRIWRKPAGALWTEAVLHDALVGEATTIGGLVNGTPYEFRLKAVDANGNESPGILANATPLPSITIGGLGDYASVADALAAAVAGDTIWLGPGNFAGPLTLPPGVSIAGSSPLLTTITGGLVVQGAYLTDPASTIRDLTITGGTVGVAGGAADVLLDHVVIHHAGSHGATSSAAGRLQALSCTVVSNGGDGLFAQGVASARNCIVGDNAGTGLNLPAGSPAAYNDVYGNAPDFAAGVSGAGNLPGAAIFNDDAAFDYRERGTSPSVDAGDPVSAFAQEPEPDGGRINIGAYGNTRWAASKTAATPAGGGGGGGGGGGCGLTGLEAAVWLLAWRRWRRRTSA